MARCADHDRLPRTRTRRLRSRHHHHSGIDTLEHLVLFLPGLWLFAFAVSPLWAAGMGIIWPIGRLIYARGYYENADRRRLGLYLSMPPIYIFVLGSLIGFGLQLVR